MLLVGPRSSTIPQKKTFILWKYNTSSHKLSNILQIAKVAVLIYLPYGKIRILHVNISPINSCYKFSLDLHIYKNYSQFNTFFFL